MKKKILIGLFVAFAIAFVASVAMAGHGYGKGVGACPGYGLAKVANLTPEQTTKIQAIRQAHLKDTSPLQQQLLAKKTELRAEWLSPNPDQAKILSLQKDILNLKGKLQEKATNVRFEVRKILTPEQQAQLATFDFRRGHGKGMMGPHMGHMGRW